MKARILLAVILLFAMVSRVDAQVAYDRKAGRISVTYQGAPLRDVLTEISLKTGIVVYIDPAVDKNVFIEAKGRPVDEVLNDVISPLNRMFIYRGNTVTGVRIYEQTPADAMQRVGAAGQPNRSDADATEQRPAPVERKEPQTNDGTARSERMQKLEERKEAREKRRKEQMERRGSDAGAGRIKVPTLD